MEITDGMGELKEAFKNIEVAIKVVEAELSDLAAQAMNAHGESAELQMKLHVYEEALKSIANGVADCEDAAEQASAALNEF